MAAARGALIKGKGSNKYMKREREKLREKEGKKIVWGKKYCMKKGGKKLRGECARRSSVINAMHAARRVVVAAAGVR